MTDLIKKNVNEILDSKTYNKVASSSLAGKLKRLNSRKALLIDVSGSMAEQMESGKTKYMAMCEVLSQLDAAECKRYEFSSGVKDITMTNELSRPNGGTNLALAFAQMKMNSIEHLILITDGVPDSEDLAIAELSGSNLKVDIIYIGPDPIPEFLTKLGKVAPRGGEFNRIKLGQMGSITLMTSKVKGLLTQ